MWFVVLRYEWVDGNFKMIWKFSKNTRNHIFQKYPDRHRIDVGGHGKKHIWQEAYTMIKGIQNNEINKVYLDFVCM